MMCPLIHRPRHSASTAMARHFPQMRVIACLGELRWSTLTHQMPPLHRSLLEIWSMNIPS